MSRINVKMMYNIIIDNLALIELVTPIILESDGLTNTDKKVADQLAISQKIFELLDDLTDEYDDDNTGKSDPKIIKRIMKQLNKQYGLVANLLFNLSNPKDDDETILGYQLSIVGNLAMHVKEFHNSEFLKEIGTHNLIEIMELMSGS